jgi:hypothetical protein
MRTQSVSYWVHQLKKDNHKAEPKDENENSLLKLAEFYLLEKEKTAA